MAPSARPAGVVPTGLGRDQEKTVFTRLADLLAHCEWFSLAPATPLRVGKDVGPLDRRGVDSLSNRIFGLVCDPAHGQDPTEGSLNEGAVGLAAELGGVIPGPIQRETSGQAEFIDGKGGAWDVKAPLSPPPGAPWHFDAQELGRSVRKDLGQKNDILLDLSRCNPSDTAAVFAELRQGFSPAELSRILVVKRR